MVLLDTNAGKHAKAKTDSKADQEFIPTELLLKAKIASSQLKAMAHENRLAILFHLHSGPKSVSQLEALLGLRQPAVSQLLARLRSDNMVMTERRGKQVYYSISDDEAHRIVELLHDLFTLHPGEAAE